MAIVKELEIKISNDQASFNEKFYVYQNDRGIDLKIKVKLSKLQISSSVSFVSELEGARAGAVILKPNGEIIGRDNLVVDGDYIIFSIDHSLTDELDEVGNYKIQFHLYDNSDNRITIPPVDFEVKALLGVIPDTL